MALGRPLPRGMRIVRATAGDDGEVIYTVVMSLPEGVLEVFGEALELAALVSGSDRLGARLVAIASEFLSTWWPKAKGATNGAADEALGTFLGKGRTR